MTEYTAEDLEKLARGQVISRDAFRAILADPAAAARLAAASELFSEAEPEPDPLPVARVPFTFDELADCLEGSASGSAAERFIDKHFRDDKRHCWPWYKMALAASIALTVACFGEGVLLVDGNKALAAAQAEIESLSKRLQDVIAQLSALQIDKAIDESSPHLYVAGRDRFGLRCRIDLRYIGEVKWRVGSEGDFETVFKAGPLPRGGDYPILEDIQKVSEPVALDGRAERVFLEFVPRSEIKDSELARQIPESLRRQEREFLLSANGITADPRPLDLIQDVTIKQVMSDSDAQNANRYIVTGQIRGLAKGISAYLVVDAVTTNEIWVTSAIQPDAAGNFVAKAFLGDSSDVQGRDLQLYGLMVVLTDRKDALNPGDRLKKPVDWEALGCRNSRMVIKRNDGDDGFTAAP